MMNWPLFRTMTSSLSGEVALEDALLHLIKDRRPGQLPCASLETMHIVPQSGVQVNSRGTQ
jgi:hypothetical protein